MFSSFQESASIHSSLQNSTAMDGQKLPPGFGLPSPAVYDDHLRPKSLVKGQSLFLFILMSAIG
jgi:hypothetical protein